MQQTEFTRTEREALKAIYRFTRDGSEAHTGTLADRLGLSPGTVTTLVKRLADRGLVDHRPYQGVTFTDVGRQAAVAAIRRHRIVERFLADMLGYAWNEADELAVSFEHDLPDEVTERLHARVRRAETKLALARAGAVPSLIEDLANAAEFAGLVVDDADQVTGLDDAIKAHRSRVPDAYRAPAAQGPGSVDGGPRAPGTPRATDLASAVAARLGSRTG